MANLNDLLKLTSEAPLWRLPNASDGGHFNPHELGSLGNLAKGHKLGNKYFIIDVYDGEDEFLVDVYEVTTGLTAKPSVRIKSPRKRQMIRNVFASVPPIDDYNTIADAVRDVVAKLCENYSARYGAALDLPLEEIISSKASAYRLL